MTSPATEGPESAGSGHARLGPSVWVVGVDDQGGEVVRVLLGHGDEPEAVLARLGWASLEPRTVVAQSHPHEVAVFFAVERGPGGHAAEGARRGPADAELVVRPGEAPVVVQRLAAYAMVRSPRGLLLTQNSARTNAAGTWGLAGGGVDPGELPEDTLHREVWEETGQRVRVDGLVAVTTRHWVGRAPDGRLEDFHAVRLVYRATCDAPTDPVVHDIDGTTAAAGWFADAEVARLPLSSGTGDVVRGLIGDGG